MITIEKEWAQAFVNNDPEAIGRYMAHDWTVVSPDGSVIDKATFLALVKSGVLAHERMEFDEMKVRVYGEMAVVTARATSIGKFKTKSFTERELVRRLCKTGGAVEVRINASNANCQGPRGLKESKNAGEATRVFTTARKARSLRLE